MDGVSSAAASEGAWVGITPSRMDTVGQLPTLHPCWILRYSGRPNA
jgi:hypothetical protein